MFLDKRIVLLCLVFLSLLGAVETNGFGLLDQLIWSLTCRKTQ